MKKNLLKNALLAEQSSYSLLLPVEKIYKNE